MKPIQPMQVDKDKKNYIVQYYPYDPVYSKVFERICQLIETEAGPVRVEHVGSSSIPGVGGRRVIDVAIVAEQPEHARIREAMDRLGFGDPPFQHYQRIQIGVIENEGIHYQILLYVVTPDAELLQTWLSYRDYLRAHPAEAEAYGQVKREVLAAGHTNGESYQQAKTPFIVELNARIQAAGSEKA